MYSSMKKFLSILFAVCSLGAAVFAVSPAFAKITCPDGTIGAKDEVERNSLAECDITIGTDEAEQVTNRVESAINVVLSFVGVAAVAVIIIGGIQYITSQGDVAKAARARNIILYGIIGLVICLLAFAIVNLVLTGVFHDPPKSEEG